MSDQSWTASGTYDVGHGIHRIPLPLPNDGLRAVNVYAIVDGDQVVLIDSGWALEESRHLLEKALAELGCGLGDVREFLVTHMHRDHYSQAIALRRTFGMPVSLGEGERASLAAIRAYVGGEVRPQAFLRRAGAFDLLEELRQASHVPDLDEYDEPDGWLTDGVELQLSTRTLRVVATPGHTRGHVVFYDDSAGSLFAGDHVLPHITPSIAVEPNPSGLPLRNYLKSLRLVRSMPDARLLPAHGPTSESVHARVDELLDHHERRLAAMAAAVDGGAQTAAEVARVVRWTSRGRRLEEMDRFNRVLAVGESLAHLDVLVARGWLAVRNEDGVAYFGRA